MTLADVRGIRTRPFQHRTFADSYRSEYVQTKSTSTLTSLTVQITGFRVDHSLAQTNQGSDNLWKMYQTKIFVCRYILT